MIAELMFVLLLFISKVNCFQSDEEVNDRELMHEADDSIGHNEHIENNYSFEKTNYALDHYEFLGYGTSNDSGIVAEYSVNVDSGIGPRTRSYLNHDAWQELSPSQPDATPQRRSDWQFVRSIAKGYAYAKDIISSLGDISSAAANMIVSVATSWRTSNSESGICKQKYWYQKSGAYNYEFEVCKYTSAYHGCKNQTSDDVYRTLEDFLDGVVNNYRRHALTDRFLEKYESESAIFFVVWHRDSGEHGIGKMYWLRCPRYARYG